MVEQQIFRTTEDDRRAAALDFDSLRLPDKRYHPSSPPDTQETKELAEYVRAQLAPHAGRLAMMESIAEAQNWVVKYRRIGDEESKIQALLTPTSFGFSIAVNTLYEPNDDQAAALIGHELGHTFFYDAQATPPRRITRQFNARPEEDFCDRFAYELTGIDLRKPLLP